MRLRRETVAEQSLQMLKNHMLEGTLRPGDLITEEAMARDIGISRPTMREVLNTLTVEGLLTRSPTTRILHVTRISAEKIREIYAVRRILEVAGIEAARNASDSAFLPLETATAQLAAAATAHDGPGVVKADIACHVATVALAGADDLAEFYHRQLTKLQLAIAQIVSEPDYDNIDLSNHHQEFLELMVARRTEEAKEHLLGRLDRAESLQLGTAEA